MFTLRCLIFTATIILGSFLSRWHGGGFFPAPKWVKNLAFSLPVGVSLIFLSYQGLMTLGYGNFADVFAAILATGMILGFKAIGHGGGFDLGHSELEPGNGRDLERVERWFFLYPKAYNSLPRYWYDLLILIAKGGLMSLAPAALLGVKSLVAAVIMFSGGIIGFPLAYVIGWGFFDYTELLTKLKLAPTELAELISGALFFGAFVLSVYVVI